MDVHFESAGAGPRVLLIQGVGVAGCGWAPQVEGLSDAFELAWFDNVGVGQSPGKPGTVDDMADVAVEVLDALGWEDAHVVGHSLGGVIASRLALKAPERVKSLALLCTFATGRNTLSLKPSTIWTQLRTVVGTRDMRRRAFFELVSDPKIEPTEANLAQLEAVFGRSLVDLPPGTQAQVLALVRTDHRPELARLRGVPALVASARDDRTAPASEGRVLAEGLGVPFHELEGGHACVAQDPAPVNALLRSFWADA
jgi:pimeloyl-ACP methyl ester carboxylesterase